MFLSVLLQITETEAGTTQSMIDLIKAGGWTMYPQFAFSLLAIYIIVERVLAFKAAGKDSQAFMDKVKTAVNAKDVKGAMALCDAENTPVARMIHKGLRRLGNPLKAIEESIENVGKIEIDSLEKNLNLLATISGAAPMLGFLGTVLGMISTFNVIANEGSANMDSMAAGISEAMITTATGLIIGITAYVAYSFLSTSLQKIIHRMEFTVIEFMDILQEPSK